MALAYRHYAQSLDVIGDAGGAQRAIDRAATLDPDDPQTRPIQADLAFDRRDWLAAVEALRTLQALSPGDHDVGVRLGVALDMAGQTDAARAAFDRVLAIEPDHPAARTGLAVTLHNYGWRLE